MYTFRLRAVQYGAQRKFLAKLTFPSSAAAAVTHSSDRKKPDPIHSERQRLIYIQTQPAPNGGQTIARSRRRKERTMMSTELQQAIEGYDTPSHSKMLPGESAIAAALVLVLALEQFEVAERRLEVRVLAQHAVLDPPLHASPRRPVVAAVFRFESCVELEELAEDQELVGKQGVSGNRRRVVRQQVGHHQAAIHETNENTVGVEHLGPAVRRVRFGVAQHQCLVRCAAGGHDPGFPAQDRFTLDGAFEKPEMKLWMQLEAGQRPGDSRSPL